MGELNSTGVRRSQSAAGPFEPQGSALDVLIVEDDALMRRRLQALIENAGYGVISVGSASEAHDMTPHCGAAACYDGHWQATLNRPISASISMLTYGILSGAHTVKHLRNRAMATSVYVGRTGYALRSHIRHR